MSSSASGSSASSVSLTAESNTQVPSVEVDGSSSNEPLYLLAKGKEQFIRIQPRSMLENAMYALGLKAEPLFSVEECDDGCVKVSITLDVSNLTTVNGECISLSIVHGDSLFNSVSAENSAVMMAFKKLEENYRVRVVDFSSRLANNLENSKTFAYFTEPMGSLNEVLHQWDLAFAKFENLSVTIETKGFSGNVSTPGSPCDKVFGLLDEYLSSVHNSLNDKFKDLKSELEDIDLDRRCYERKMLKRGREVLLLGNYQEVDLTSKFLLAFVLEFYHLDEAKYRSSPEPDGRVKSIVSFIFPFMDDFKFGGEIEIDGYGKNSVQAHDDAAYHALLFIEKHFNKKVLDFNYSKRKKAVKKQHTLNSMLSKALNVGDSLKMMFGELINAIELKCMQFSFDPNVLNGGCFSGGHSDAYHVCCNGLKELGEYVVRCYGECGSHFDVLYKLTWKLTAPQNDLELY